jgi:hypothetical protein
VCVHGRTADIARYRNAERAKQDTAT